MKTLIATSVIALAGLYASFSHAADVKSYLCATSQCTGIETPYERCTKWQRTGVITDKGDTFEAVDAQLGYAESSPKLSEMKERKGFFSGETISRGDDIIFIRTQSPQGYSIINKTRRVGFVAAKCELISVEHEKARN